MITVKATREGLLGQKTASGYVIDAVVPFVALPSAQALGKFIRISNPANGKSTIAWVGEVGPWNSHDNSYVFGTARPRAERQQSFSMRGTNTAGIDLGERIWKDIGMLDNTDVEWEFLPGQGIVFETGPVG